MFDFGFKKWLTPICVKAVYSVVCLFIFIILASVIVWMFVDQRYWQAGLTLVFGTFAAIIIISLMRVILECSLAMVRNMQSTTVLVHQAWSSKSGSGGRPDYPVQPENPPVTQQVPHVQQVQQGGIQQGGASPFQSAPSNPYNAAPAPYDNNAGSYENPTVDGMGADGFYYHNGVPYRQVVVNTEKGPQQQWHPVMVRR